MQSSFDQASSMLNRKLSLGGITPLGDNPLHGVFIGEEIAEFDEVTNTTVPIMVSNKHGYDSLRNKRLKHLEKAKQVLLSATCKQGDLIFVNPKP